MSLVALAVRAFLVLLAWKTEYRVLKESHMLLAVLEKY